MEGGQTNETAFNYALGEVLQTRRRGWRGRVETEKNGSVYPRKRADNLIYPDAMQPVVVEAAFAGTPNIDKDAIDRLGLQVKKNKRDIMTAVALAIPAPVRGMKDAAEIREWLAGGGKLQYAVYSLVKGESGELPECGYDTRYPDGKPNSGYISGTAADLADLIELAATPDKKIKQVAEQVGGAVRGVGAMMYDKLPEFIRCKIAEKVGQPPDAHAMRVAACVWLNAMSLHSKLAAARSDFPSPRECRTLMQTVEAWRGILEVDYNSVFRPALESLELLSDHGDLASAVLDDLFRQVGAMNELHLGGIADVSSDMFPELATDRKTTAAFYTRMEVAELLAGLAFNLIPDDGRELKIADFACGTGALLKAAYRRVRRRAEPKTDVDMSELHRKYMEDCLHGADIQPIAAHLTAAGLAGMHPAADYRHSNVICTDVRNGKTGSLDLLEEEALEDLFGVSSVTAVDGKREHNFRPKNGTFDLCIMNPPYSRPHRGREIFGVEGLPEYQRKKSTAALSKLLDGSFAGMNAGMASAFCRLADIKLKTGGVLAAVLPSSAGGQYSWREFRAHMVNNYSDIVVVGMASESFRSFSADTDMGEILICARKGGNAKRGIAFINLWNFPRGHAAAASPTANFVEANEIARALRSAVCPRRPDSGDLAVGEYVFATCFYAECRDDDAWGGVGVKSAGMARIAEKLARGSFSAPGVVQECAAGPPMLPLERHAEIGPSHDHIGHPPGGDGRGAFAFRDIRRGDRVNLSLWAARHKTQRRLECAPTHAGELSAGREQLVARYARINKCPREKAAEKLKELAAHMLKKQSTLFISRSLRMTSQTVASAATEKPCMGGSAWNALDAAGPARAAYCLWFNGVFGLVLRWQCAGRQHPGRAQMQLGDIKKFPCPEFSGKGAAAKKAVKIANAEFPRLAKLDLMPCSYAWRDENRKQIDAAVLRMLGLEKEFSEKDMQQLREEWCKEPSVHGGNKAILKALHADGLR